MNHLLYGQRGRAYAVLSRLGKRLETTLALGSRAANRRRRQSERRCGCRDAAIVLGVGGPARDCSKIVRCRWPSRSACHSSTEVNPLAICCSERAPQANPSRRLIGSCSRVWRTGRRRCARGAANRGPPAIARAAGRPAREEERHRLTGATSTTGWGRPSLRTHSSSVQRAHFYTAPRCRGLRPPSGGVGGTMMSNRASRRPYGWFTTCVRPRWMSWVWWAPFESVPRSTVHPTENGRLDSVSASQRRDGCPRAPRPRSRSPILIRFANGAFDARVDCRSYWRGAGFCCSHS